MAGNAVIIVLFQNQGSFYENLDWQAQRTSCSTEYLNIGLCMSEGIYMYQDVWKEMSSKFLYGCASSNIHKTVTPTIFKKHGNSESLGTACQS